MSEISQWEAKAMGLAERLRASEARVKELAEKWTHDMKEAEQRIKELDADYRRVIREVLACDPRPAKDRADDQLEPPWEVVARVRRERDEARPIVEAAMRQYEAAAPCGWIGAWWLNPAFQTAAIQLHVTCEAAARAAEGGGDE